jgi:predicted ATPase
MKGKQLLHSVSLSGLLSYGPQGEPFKLEPLNVLIGPNASGKSNLIDGISLLAAAPRNLLTPFREAGSFEDWLWKGSTESSVARISAAVPYQGSTGVRRILGYDLSFRVSDVRLSITEEHLFSQDNFYLLRDWRSIQVPRHAEGLASVFTDKAIDTKMGWDKIDPQQSMLSQVRDPVNYPQLTYVGDQFGKIRFFRGWPFSRGNVLRRPQDVNLPDDFLLEDGSNLGLVLNDLQSRRETKRLLLEKLRLLYPNIEDVTTKVQGGTIRILFYEEGLNKPIPAARLSDGTLHYLCLLIVLLHPEPPPLICIEEPELGLHPDVIRTIGKLLIEASERTQLIVTTHSESLVSALSEVPEAVVVCERDDQGTQLRRLDPEKMKLWLERYSLGDLWVKGEIGGNRW